MNTVKPRQAKGLASSKNSEINIKLGLASITFFHLFKLNLANQEWNSNGEWLTWYNISSAKSWCRTFTGVSTTLAGSCHAPELLNSVDLAQKWSWGNYIMRIYGKCSTKSIAFYIWFFLYWTCWKARFFATVLPSDVK